MRKFCTQNLCHERKVKSKISEARLPLSNNKIHYGGQIVGLVVAETFEQAREATSKVKIKYNTQAPVIKTEQTTLKKSSLQIGEEFGFKVGDIAAGLASAVAREFILKRLEQKNTLVA
ncbi:hypothetical protein [Gloeothece verrucosa]|uniref:hypothetical protein n=1 Tax=Gloeothece verrucosa TaxID=2546359 RepID=UPI0002EB654D|nr:hypothetical protein [Gloeothece verrucosa]